VRVNDIGPADGSEERWYDRPRRVAAHVTEWAQDPNPQRALAPIVGHIANGDELAIDPPGQCPGELERISLATAEQTA
jgi:hypothetical protein